MPVPQPDIRPRSDWARGMAALGPLESEDVRFLLVHHTAGPNVGPEKSVEQLRSFFKFHTGPEKRWPDIAYNFLVDSGGQIWEGRTGSLLGPVRADATGGSQGFAQLCCFMGDFTSIQPTPEATSAMNHLLAWLADRYAVSLAEGATATFVSRGSSRWPVGATVTTPTIAGHRDMSRTGCPGDAAYDMLETTFRPEARAILVAANPPPEAPSPSPSDSATSGGEASPGTPSAGAATPSGDPRATSSPSALAVGEGVGDSTPWPLLVSVGGVAVAAGLAGLGWALRRRMAADAGQGTRHRAADE